MKQVTDQPLAIDLAPMALAIALFIVAWMVFSEDDLADAPLIAATAFTRARG